MSSGITAIAKHDFLGQSETELTFQAGARITVITEREPGDWWKGEIGGKRGFFPSSFCDICRERATSTETLPPDLKKTQLATQAHNLKRPTETACETSRSEHEPNTGTTLARGRMLSDRLLLHLHCPLINFRWGKLVCLIGLRQSHARHLHFSRKLQGMCVLFTISQHLGATRWTCVVELFTQSSLSAASGSLVRMIPALNVVNFPARTSSMAQCWLISVVIYA